MSKGNLDRLADLLESKNVGCPSKGETGKQELLGLMKNQQIKVVFLSLNHLQIVEPCRVFHF